MHEDTLQTVVMFNQTQFHIQSNAQSVFSFLLDCVCEHTWDTIQVTKTKYPN